MTLTYPTLNRSRRILWIVNGREKIEMLVRLRAENLSIPAGRVNRKQALVLADCAAAGQADPAEVKEVRRSSVVSQAYAVILVGAGHVHLG